jgi:hypothetical protein
LYPLLFPFCKSLVLLLQAGEVLLLSAALFLSLPVLAMLQLRLLPEFEELLVIHRI